MSGATPTPWRLRLLLIPALLLAGCAGLPAVESLRDAPPRTIATVTEHHQPGGNWLTRRLWSGTPSTLRVSPSAPVLAELRTALSHYDSLLQLGDAIDPALRADALRRAGDLRLTLIEAGAGQPEDARQAVAGYRQLLAEQPAYPLTDQVQYQWARALDMLGDSEGSASRLQTLAHQHPASRLRADALFRAAEYRFLTRDFVTATPLYQAVLAAGADSDLAPMARHKLGWSLFREERPAEALAIAHATLDATLPTSVADTPEAALSATDSDQREQVADALRLSALSYIALAGEDPIGAARGAARPPRFERLLYQTLAEALLARQRHGDAARTWQQLAARDPDHADAPSLHWRAVLAWREGGLQTPALSAMADYVERYAPSEGALPDATEGALRDTLHESLDTLGRHHQARAQQLQQTDPAAAGERFIAAARWHGLRLQLFPEDPARIEIALLRADALLDGGDTTGALEAYVALAFRDPAAPRAGEAAAAAVQVTLRRVREADDAARAGALDQAAATALQLATAFPDHPRRAAALVHAAAALAERGDDARAVTVARQALDAGPDPALRREALSVVAESLLRQQHFDQAEAAYAAWHGALTADDPLRPQVTEAWAATLYRQGEAALADDNPLAAATHFLRVGTVTPAASLRNTADFDAAAALISAEAWPRAAAVLEGLRLREADPGRLSAIDHKLAFIHDQAGNPAAAAPVYLRIAADDGAPVAQRRDAAWQAAIRFDRAEDTAGARDAWARYVSQYPQPLEASQQARQRLVMLAADGAARDRWQQHIVEADHAAGDAAPPASRLIAAETHLALARGAAERARAQPLRAPLETYLPRRTEAVEAAVTAYRQAAAYGFAEITTAATHELGGVYDDLAAALLAAAPPSALQQDALALSQFTLLLEEQAFPFEERAISAYETNLARLQGQGLWDDWIHRSVDTLGARVPARYGKQERWEMRYDTLD
ncbi:hypothetical protein JN531_004815 [Flagellatimonas centrodinii]|uniref:hypothetical protein n=1 Tax=Flagellatimonas centrodinii TaxID=2806210 RepID=UPI001FEFC119|nr:hypothetical protein [Flagellatimonas centrodinii]ULQ47609.1 hypothetical protein JN531_004815 [Flagellatimonas centrodinii]